MSERTYAPRSGGRGRGHEGSRDAETRGTGARGARRSAEQDDTRRSGIRREERAGGRRMPEAPIAGANALQLDPARRTEAAGAPALRVAPPVPVRAPRATFAAGVIALVLVGVLGILLINTQTMKQSFRLAELESGRAALDKRQQELDQQLNAARKPGQLRASFERLGLVQADPNSLAMIRLPDGTIIRTPTKVDGVPSVTAQDPLVTGGNGNGTAANGAGQ